MSVFLWLQEYESKFCSHIAGLWNFQPNGGLRAKLWCFEKGLPGKSLLWDQLAEKEGDAGILVPSKCSFSYAIFFFYIYSHFVVQNYVHFFLSTQNKSLREGLPVGRKVGRKRNSGIPSLLFSVYLKIHNYLFYKCHNLLMEEEKLFYPHHPPPPLYHCVMQIVFHWD